MPSGILDSGSNIKSLCQPNNRSNKKRNPLPFRLSTGRQRVSQNRNVSLLPTHTSFYGRPQKPARRLHGNDVCHD
ncbi:MAG TPA: hypothetical protein VGO96_11560, partial [Pyrinomonadaceae bacterium]|nr:hypothetical protein [Pyrinomonadaceae bacterium]